MSSVLPVYSRSDLYFEKGEGVYVYAPDGTKYLDFAAGIAVNALGHCHPALVDALQDQAAKLWHVSNLYQIPLLEEFATALAESTFADYAFFCSSGAEAVECGIKMIRKYQHSKGNGKYRIITFKGCFHGRTIATISAAGSEKLLNGFEPALDGFDYATFNDIDSVKALITDKTAGILIEPVQGEGGINPACHCFLNDLRALADEHELALMFDEVQCGMGRTGKLFAYEHYGIEPDILASAKGIGGGFPLGACLSKTHIADAMTPGSHGSTYGSNPLAIRVGYEVLKHINQPDFLQHTLDISAYLIEKLTKLKQSYPKVIDTVRGMGLMIGIKIFPSNLEFVNTLRESKLLTVPAGDNVVRLLPPLIITKQDVDNAVDILEQACQTHNE